MPEKIDDLFEFYNGNHSSESEEPINKPNSKYKRILSLLFRAVRNDRGKTSNFLENGWGERRGGKEKRKKFGKNYEERKEMLRRNIENSWIELPTTLQRKKEKISKEILSEYHSESNDADDPLDKDHSYISVAPDLDHDNEFRSTYDYKDDNDDEDDDESPLSVGEFLKITENQQSTSIYTKMNGNGSFEEFLECEEQQNVYSEVIFNGGGEEIICENYEEQTPDLVKSDESDGKEEVKQIETNEIKKSENEEGKEENDEDEGKKKNKFLFNAAVKEMNFLFNNLSKKCAHQENRDIFKMLGTSSEKIEPEDVDVYENMSKIPETGEEINANSQTNTHTLEEHITMSEESEFSDSSLSVASGTHPPESKPHENETEKKQTTDSPEEDIYEYYEQVTDDSNYDKKPNLEDEINKSENTFKTAEDAPLGSYSFFLGQEPKKKINSIDLILGEEKKFAGENHNLKDNEGTRLASNEEKRDEERREEIKDSTQDSPNNDKSDAGKSSDKKTEENCVKKVESEEKMGKDDGKCAGKIPPRESSPDHQPIYEISGKLTEEEKAKKKSAEAIAKELASHVFSKRKNQKPNFSEKSGLKQIYSSKSRIWPVEKSENWTETTPPPPPMPPQPNTPPVPPALPSSPSTDKTTASALARLDNLTSDQGSGDRLNPGKDKKDVANGDVEKEKDENLPKTLGGNPKDHTPCPVTNWLKIVTGESKPETKSEPEDNVSEQIKIDSSKMTVVEILKRFEELGNKHFSEESSLTEDERTVTLREIHRTLKCLEEKVRNFETWNKAQQYHERVHERPSEAWTGRGPMQKAPHPQPVRNHLDPHEEEIVQTSINDGKHSLLQFAIHHFRQSPEKFEMLKTSDGSISGSLKVIEGKNKKSKEKGKQTKNTSEWTWKEQVDLVKFTAKPITQSLLQLETHELSDLAVECFICLMRYMGDLPMPTDVSEVKCVYTILMHCHKFEQLRDEIYCQLMKQTTNNKSIQQESCQRGWRLFSIVAAYFVSSDTLKPFLFKYLETAAYDKRRAYHGTAMVCLQNLRKTFKYGGRKNVPSVEEITAISAGRNSKRQIYRLPGGTEKVVNTKSTTVVQDVIEELCVMINVTNPQEMEEFSVYCIVEGDTFTMPLAREEYILDVTTELHKNHQVFYLIFCRSVWYFPLRLDSQLYIEVVFNQIAPDYLEGLLLVMPGESLEQDVIYDISRIAALLHKAADMPRVPTMKETKFLLPKPALGVRDVKPSQWVNMVQSNWQDCENMTTIQAKAQVLDVLSKWPLFGSSFFAVRKAAESKDITDHILALNRNGVHFIDLITHETLLHYPFSEVISTRKVKSEDGTLFLDMKCGNLMQQRITRLQTDQAHEISRLIRQYITMQQRMGANNN